MARLEPVFKYFDRIIQTLEGGDASGALALTHQLMQDYPEERFRLIFWEMCILTRMGRQAEALSVFASALDQGAWWDEAMLREDPDMKPLQGDPEFERLVENTIDLRNAALKEIKPTRIIIPTYNKVEPTSWLMAMHGRSIGANTSRKKWGLATGMGWKVVLPQSSQLSWPGAPCWDDRQLAEEEICTHWNELTGQETDLNRLVLAGFSQGAALAIRLCLSSSLPAAGCIAVATGTLDIDSLTINVEAQQQPRVYLISGKSDRRFGQHEQLKNKLKDLGIGCEMEIYPDLGHEFPRDFKHSLETAIAFITS